MVTPSERPCAGRMEDVVDETRQVRVWQPRLFAPPSAEQAAPLRMSTADMQSYYYATAATIEYRAAHP